MNNYLYDFSSQSACKYTKSFQNHKAFARHFALAHLGQACFNFKKPLRGPRKRVFVFGESYANFANAISILKSLARLAQALFWLISSKIVLSRFMFHINWLSLQWIWGRTGLFFNASCQLVSLQKIYIMVWHNVTWKTKKSLKIS